MTLPPSPSAAALKRLLIVEDDALVRHALMRQLNRAYAVEGAGTGQEAIAAVARTSFDMVLTDYAMPDQSGVAMARSLRASGFRSPIVLITAVPTAVDIPEALQAGVIQAVVPKPWTYRELIQLIRERLR